jgi:glycosyltransferase involved in cell wall biosynthesis
MKVILTVERYAPAIGGAERVVERIAEGLVARGHAAAVVTSGERSSEMRHGVQVERFPVRGNAHRRIRGDVRAPLELIRDTAADVVLNYAAQTWTTDSCMELLDRPGHAALVLAPCGFSALHRPRWRRYFEELRHRLPQYDALIFHSSRYRDWDFAVSAGAERRHVIRNGADPPASGGGLRTRLAPGEGLMVTVGSHVRSKGHRDFARAHRAVRRDQRVRGVIVAPPRRGLDGIRGCQGYCSAMSAVPGNGLDLLDGRSRATVEDAIASADVLLLPSRVECSPLVIIEAMAAGVPWVSYDVGNIHELAGGLVVDGVRELAGASAEVLRGHHPQLGAEGTEAWSRDHRWEKIVANYERVLSSAVERRSRAEAARSLAARAE